MQLGSARHHSATIEQFALGVSTTATDRHAGRADTALRARAHEPLDGAILEGVETNDGQDTVDRKEIEGGFQGMRKEFELGVDDDP